MKIVIGVEGGGTYTRAAAVSVDNFNILKLSVSGPSNYHNVGMKETLKNIKIAIESAAENNEIIHITLGLPAMNTKYDRVRLSRAIRRILPSMDIIIEHDVHVALYGATRGEPGILVVAGTGSNVYGYLYGARIYAGDWGWKVGDEGSAYKLSISLINLALQEFDGRREKIGVLEAILEYLGAKDFDTLLNWIYNANIEEIAKLSILACYLSKQYEDVRNIIMDASYSLAMAVKAVRNKIKLNSVPIYYTGGLFNCKLFKENFIKNVSKIKGLSIRELKVPPVIGATLISLDTLGYKIPTEELLKNLKMLKTNYPSIPGTDG